MSLLYDVFAGLVGFITVLCILLNTIGVYAFLRMPRTPSNLVYLHLCFTDLIVGLFVTPFSIVLLRNNLDSNQKTLCVMQGVMFEISYTTTLLILTYISLDRLLALYQPLKYKELMSNRALTWINICTWIIPVIRPILRYVISVVKDDEYTYTNQKFFMVCYNTDYLKFVQLQERGDTSSWTPMLDQCIIVISCQLATFISSLLVVFKLSHRLHIKRKGGKSQQSINNAVAQNQKAVQPSSTSSAVVSNPVEKKQRIHHFHAAPESIDDTIQTSGNDDTVATIEGNDDSLDSAGNKTTKLQKLKRKREAERHAIITMVTVIVFFMITYTPSFICFIVPGIYPRKGETNVANRWVYLLIDYATFINSTFLPMVHFSRSNGFKRQLRQLKIRISQRLSGALNRGDKNMDSRRDINTTTMASFNNSTGIGNSVMFGAGKLSKVNSLSKHNSVS